MFRRTTAPNKPSSPPCAASRSAPADQARLDVMFRDHHQTVWRTLRRFGLDAHEAADAGQQTYVIAAERLDDIQAGCERAFLIGTALRIAQANHRKTKRLQLEEDMDARIAERARATPDTLSDIELVDLALARMDPLLVDVFVLYELEGFSSPEIALALDLALGTVASRLRRAREGFREAARRIELLLEKEGGAT
jgi:RNA polymerase sigma-70 factor (ECF subfamily)